MQQAARTNPVNELGSDQRQGSGPTLTVFYDGECPICRKEVGFYQGMETDGKIIWRDVTALADVELPHGKSREQMLGIFHARELSGHKRDGGWKTGVDAFAAIWSYMPVFRHFAWVFKTPILRQLAKGFYHLFLVWQRRDRARRKLTASNRAMIHDASR